MKTWIAAIVAVFWFVAKLVTPISYWEKKREAAYQKLKEIDEKLNTITTKLISEMAAGNLSTWAELDIQRQQLFTKRSACERDYNHYKGLSGQKG